LLGYGCAMAMPPCFSCASRDQPISRESELHELSIYVNMAL
jgi:hypothetical protein